MAIVIAIRASEEEITLEEFLKRCESKIDMSNEESIMELGEDLASLARNKSFFAGYLRDQLLEQIQKRTDIPTGLRYSDQCLIMGRRPGFYVRLASWDAPKRRAGSDDWDNHFYSYNFAHNHNFSLLTVGLYGPGYISDNYSIEIMPQLLQPGSPVVITRQASQQLTEGAVLMYKKWFDIHVQRAPSDYSLSLNLIVDSPLTPQYSFDVRDGTVGKQIGGGDGDLIKAIEIMRGFSPEMLDHLLEQLVDQNQLPSAYLDQIKELTYRPAQRAAIIS